MIMQDCMLVIGFSDTACHSVVRKLRAERINVLIRESNVTYEEVIRIAPSGIVLAALAEGEREIDFDSRLLQAGIPVLALGDTSLKMLELLGGSVGDVIGEKELMSLHFSHSVVTDGIDDQERMLKKAYEMKIGGCISELVRAGKQVIGYVHDVMPVYGLQLEAESNDPDSAMLLKNFAGGICNCSTEWNDDKLIETMQMDMREACGDGNVLCGLTGGLDSAVAALIAHKAMPGRVKCFFADTGLLRAREVSDFIRCFRDDLGMDITLIDARERFETALKGITAAAEKKRVISALLRTLLMEMIGENENVSLIVRGTTQNDVLHKTTKPIPADIRTAEPLKEFYKDEVRHIAESLGVPQNWVTVQPFPGTGLALRIIGEVTAERLSVVRVCDDIFNDELKKSGVKRLLKSFAALVPVEDDRYIVLLRAVQVAEGERNHPVRLPYDLLETVVERILQAKACVSRVLYDMTPAPDFTGIEYN